MKYGPLITCVAAAAACLLLLPNVGAEGEGAPAARPAAAWDIAAAAAPALPFQTPAWSRRLDVEGLLASNTLFNWSQLLAAALVGLVAGKIIGAVLGRVGRRLDARGWAVRGRVLIELGGPAELALLTFGLAVGLAGLEGRSSSFVNFSSRLVLLLYAVAVSWYAFKMVAAIEILLQRRTARTASTLDRQLAPMIAKTLRTLLVLIGVMFVFEAVFNWDIGAWLAGFGIAGLAVSLAAQDSLKNIFGSITILLDRPFQIGETIAFSGYEGVVVEIGFRSTKIRTAAGHLVTIPNSNIVNGVVERKKPNQTAWLERNMNLAIPYNTPREKIARAVEIVRGILAEDGLRGPIHAPIDGEMRPPRVHFNDYNPASLNIAVTYWYTPADQLRCAEHREKLNLRIFEEFARAGIDFALPAQTIYMAGK